MNIQAMTETEAKAMLVRVMDMLHNVVTAEKGDNNAADDALIFMLTEG